MSTPREDGFAMPAEWAPHQGCLMEWPTRTRAEFNSWGERFRPYDREAAVPAAIAAHLGIRRYVAPFVLEGGSFFVDGEGTLLTTEQCLLNPNRNPDLSRAGIERGLRDFLGAEVVVWLGLGQAADLVTDGHVDGIAQYVRPGVVMIQAPGERADP